MIAAIQAGGRSSRMGQDKSWLEVGGRPMIEHCLEAARGSSDEVLIVISRDNPDPGKYANLGVQVVIDDWEHCGPLGGIATAFRYSPANKWLMLACDLPFVTDNFLKLLGAIHEGEGRKLTVPADEAGRIQMLCGIYSPECLAIIVGMLDAGVYKAQRLLERTSHRIVGFEEYGSVPYLTNINTTQEYKATNFTNLH